MERSDSLIKFVSVLVFIALVIYIGIAFYGSRTETLQTVYAVGIEINDSINTEGYIVRDETRISASGSNIAVTALEGDKVAAGEAVAVRYNGSKAMERAAEIQDIQMRIAQLTAVKNGKSNDELASESLIALSSAVASGDLDELYSLEMNIDAYIISGSELASGDEAEEIARLEEELRRLTEVSTSDTVRITVDSAGTFSHVADGFEKVSPEKLEGITPSGLKKLFSSPEKVGDDVIGKLISGIKWYYVTVMDEQSASKLTVGGRAKVEFSRTYSAALTMTVESVSLPEDGECAVVMSCKDFMQDVASLREMSGEIVFAVQSGVRVPKDALHVEEDGTYVYILEGLRASKVYVDIIAESGDYYMVEETRDGLRINDRIIVKADNLYDGAVVAE
ncbi:MAG: HlyD family efflux transporter periplasmic adaptor subunit [Oscillospiraceae bacterium]